jgi:hypothetical protein
MEQLCTPSRVPRRLSSSVVAIIGSIWENAVETFCWTTLLLPPQLLLLLPLSPMLV